MASVWIATAHVTCIDSKHILHVVLMLTIFLCSAACSAGLQPEIRWAGLHVNTQTFALPTLKVPV